PLVPVGYQYQPLNGGRWAIDMRIGPPVLREAEETDDTLRRRLEHLVGQLSGVPGSRDDGSLECGAGSYRDEGRTGTCVSGGLDPETPADAGPLEPQEHRHDGRHLGDLVSRADGGALPEHVVILLLDP